MTALTSTLPGLDDLVPLTGSGGHSVPDYWFFEETADKFGAIDPTTGHITEIPLPDNANAQVAGITAGPGGTVWFTESNTNRIGMIDTDTDEITEFPVPTPGAQPYGIVEGPDGNIWFTEAGANQIGRINPTTHVIQEFPIDSSGNDQAEGIAVGSDSNLWFTLTGINKIGVMNPNDGRNGRRIRHSDRQCRPLSDRVGSGGWEPLVHRGGREQGGEDQPHHQGHRRVRRADRGCRPPGDRGRQGREHLVHRVERQPDRRALPEQPRQHHGVRRSGPVTPLSPTVLSEEAVTMQKANKKGKKVGKPVFVGFELDYSTAMNPCDGQSHRQLPGHLYHFQARQEEACYRASAGRVPGDL